MRVQTSFSADKADRGSLYLVATPIGNLQDMTFRALDVLRDVDWIAAEDTRQTQKLLNHFAVPARLISYHEHNKRTSGAKVIELLLSGQSVALVSDAGVPGISDPGYDLVKAAVEHDIAVIPVPGANAALSALIVSGMDTSRFTFIGFLPKEKKKMLEVLERYRRAEETLILYEAPHRLVQTLTSCLQVFGEREAAVARELTKIHEEVIRGTLSECAEHFSREKPQGEFCLIIGGAKQADEAETLWWSLLSLEEHLRFYLERGLDQKTALKKVAEDRKVSKREVYNRLFAAK
jgi:16S rRNA (cytidine1402-2'-O)-methyltransferase